MLPRMPKDLENPDLEKQDLSPLPPHYRPRRELSNQQSKTMPELKSANEFIGFFSNSAQKVKTFFRDKSPLEIGFSTGLYGGVVTGLAYAVPPVLAGIFYAFPPTALAALSLGLLAGGAKQMYLESEKCRKKSEPRKVAP